MTSRVRDKPIGVFDSGVGGLSILCELRRQLPNEDFVYVADSGFAPYGERDDAFIYARSTNIAQFLSTAGVKAAVVACNTATSVAVEALRQQFSMPIVAIEPALKPAVAMTKSGVVGVLATRRTLGGERFKKLLTTHGAGVRILTQACPGLVEQVECGELDGEITESLLRQYVTPLLDQGADTLVLGCTHYPFLAATMRRIVGPTVAIVDVTEAVARQLGRVLRQYDLLSPARAGSERFYTSGLPVEVQPVIEKLWRTDSLVEALPALFSAEPIVPAV